jgi:hypothetical protein
VVPRVFGVAQWNSIARYLKRCDGAVEPDGVSATISGMGGGGAAEFGRPRWGD